MLGEIGEEVIGVRRVGREILPTDESLLSRMNCGDYNSPCTFITVSCA